MGKPISELGIKGKVLGSVKSDTTDERYTISEYEGKLACSCVGYATSRKKLKTCKHIRRWYLTNILENILLMAETFTQKDIAHEVMEIEELFSRKGD